MAYRRTSGRADTRALVAVTAPLCGECSVSAPAAPAFETFASPTHPSRLIEPFPRLLCLRFRLIQMCRRVPRRRPRLYPPRLSRASASCAHRWAPPTADGRLHTRGAAPQGRSCGSWQHPGVVLGPIAWAPPQTGQLPHLNTISSIRHTQAQNEGTSPTSPSSVARG